MTKKQRFVYLADVYLKSLFTEQTNEYMVALDCILGIPDVLIPNEDTLRLPAKQMATQVQRYATDPDYIERYRDEIGDYVDRWFRNNGER